ncbi:hypothetical protein CS063_01770 [Sporanaerobium hydrogeniformans]|uniref:Uncharacterized protein n=1 Tax=Sporanaerobium hydrogeniformans TaxID=3072179 RepID=A0AC61DGW9_9FIRM|nr:hypothetical protein [Sporanaerobium hydrogeniformans]PHV72228.1 hypothetical protein CS063_01770 [Sporanaerobium hydrogeniformans]
MKTNLYHYIFIWQVKDSQRMEDFKLQGTLEELVKGWCKEERGKVEGLVLDKKGIKLKVSTEEALYSTKFLKKIQRQMEAFFKKAEIFLDTEVSYWEGNPFVITHYPQEAKGEERLEKLLQSVLEVGYYDLKEYFTYDVGIFRDYLLQKNLGVIDHGDRVYLVDIQALKKPIYLNCFDCTKIHQYGCCCGSPCDFGGRNLKNFKMHLPFIEEEVRYADEVSYQAIKERGGFIRNEGQIRAYNGHCTLLIKEGESYKCVAHKYALDHQIPIYDLCPLSCLMYPLEIMELITNKQKKILFFTSVIDPYFANKFGRWGSYASLGMEMRCLKKEAHNEIFKEEHYRPVYEVNRELICHEWGKLFFDALKVLM